MSAQQGACESGQIWPIFTDIKQVQEKCIAYPNIRTNLYISRVVAEEIKVGNDSNLLIVFYVQIMPDDFVMQLHRF